MTLPDLVAAADAVLIDCDGVLCDTEPVSQRAWTVTLRRFRVEVDGAEFTAVVGGTERDVAERFAGRAGVDPAELERLARGDLLEILADGVDPFPDTMALVDRLEVPVAVVSNSYRWRLDAVLAAAGVADRLGVTVAGDEVPRPKPAPDSYREAARRLGVDPAGCLVIEDSPTGVRAAVAAGAPVVAVDRGMFDPDALAEATLVVPSLHLRSV